MALYTIGDLHLSLGSNKPMDIFGDRWQNYVEKIRLGFSALTADDTTVLCGDLSWGMSLEEGKKDHPEGQPRLLVEHRVENAALFRGQRAGFH